MPIYLSTYRPLVATSRGGKVCEKYGLPPYVDDSIRREPDFESRYPSISALCHGRNFAPRLYVGDLAVYMTKKGLYPHAAEPDHRLVAILEVVERFESHEVAACWYRARGLPLPSNCLVEGNPPLPLSMASSHKSDDDDDGLAAWDEFYHQRTRRGGAFLACIPRFLDMKTPPSISDERLIHVFGKIPGTRTPPRITQEQYDNLVEGFEQVISV